MVNVLTKKKKKKKEHKDILRGNGDVEHLGCGDGVVSMYTCPNSARCTH